MLTNAVLRLRHQRITQSTKPFLARGCRVTRCQRCLLPVNNCLCATLKQYPARSRFCLLMYDTEPMKPSNTGRLIADVLPNTEAFQWSRKKVDPALLNMLNDPTMQPYVVFPTSYTSPDRLNHELPKIESAKTPLFIMLDGTWPEARKMFRKSPYLDPLPVFSVNMEKTDYILRNSYHAEQYCTAEVAVALLQLAGDIQASKGLLQHFLFFRQQYLLGKSHVPLISSPNRTAMDK